MLLGSGVNGRDVAGGEVGGFGLTTGGVALTTGGFALTTGSALDTGTVPLDIVPKKTLREELMQIRHTRAASPT